MDSSESVYVVHTWSDRRKENDGEVLKVYRTERSARKALKKFAKECQEDNDAEIEEFANGYNVIIHGSDYRVFEVVEKQVEDDSDDDV